MQTPRRSAPSPAAGEAARRALRPPRRAGPSPTTHRSRAPCSRWWTPPIPSGGGNTTRPAGGWAPPLPREFFMPRFLERDEAERAAPAAEYPWDGVSNVRLLGALESSVVFGVY